MSADGEPFILGQFYDVRTQRLVYQGMSFWSRDKLANAKTKPIRVTSLDVSCYDKRIVVYFSIVQFGELWSMKERIKHLRIDIKASLKIGCVSGHGSCKNSSEYSYETELSQVEYLKQSRHSQNEGTFDVIHHYVSHSTYIPTEILLNLDYPDLLKEVTRQNSVFYKPLLMRRCPAPRT